MTAEELYYNFQDRQQWLEEILTGMTILDFEALIDFIFQRLDIAAEAKDGSEFTRVKGLMLAVARKQLEAAHFSDEISDDHRASLMTAADTMFDLAKGFYPPAKQSAVQAAWDAALDYAQRFGYSAGVVFEVMAPHHVFRAE